MLIWLAAAISIPGSAQAQMTAIPMDDHHTKYEGDFTSGKEALAACNAIAANYGSSCGSFGYPDSNSIYHFNGYSAGWLGTTYSVLITAYYCEPSDFKVEGSHKCVGSVKLPRSDPKNNGNPKDCACEDEKKAPPVFGNPINAATGNKFQREVDFSIANDASELRIERSYNSAPTDSINFQPHLFGRNWLSPYDAHLYVEPARQTVACYRRNDDGRIICIYTQSAVPAVAILRGDGKIYRFSQAGSTWTPDADVNDRVASILASDNVTITGYLYTSAAGDRVEQFDVAGRLIKVTARNGATQFLTYSDGTSNDTSLGRVPADAPSCNHVQPGTTLPAGLLLCASDSLGRQINFEHGALSAQVTAVIDPTGQQFAYEYDGPSGGCVPGNDPLRCASINMTKVSYPGGTNKTYWYDEAAYINGGTACPYTVALGNGFASPRSQLTGIVDENGARFATWTYNCSGVATSSQHALGTEKVTLTVATGSSSVTHYVGTPIAPVTTSVTLGFTTVQGVAKMTQLYGNCVECGATSTATFDVNGNTSSAIDFNGNLNCYGYDLARNLETVRVEGLPGSTTCSTALTAATLTAPARRITTQWHPTYRLRTLVAEPLKITSFQYDANGNVLVRSEQATTDASGTAGATATVTGPIRRWTYTYNALGQVLTVTGPRTDVADVTTYSYDGQANLVSVVAADGKVTTYSNYDGNGRANRIVYPNGVTVDMVYHPRGWLLSRTASAGGISETSAFEYDGLGQLKSATTPDGAKIIYTYDDAHRLTDVADSMGNSVHYTLDYRGNRISEQTRDPSGNLSRQVSRVYTTLNRLQSQTGGAQ